MDFRAGPPRGGATGLEPIWRKVLKIMDNVTLLSVLIKSRLSRGGINPHETMRDQNEKELLARARDLLERQEEVPRREWRGVLAETLVMLEKQQQLHQEKKARHQAEEKLAEALEALSWQETQSRFTEELVNLGSWVYDLSTNEIWWSANLVRMFGFEEGREEIEFEEMLKRLHEEDRERWMAALERLMTEGKPYVCKLKVHAGEGQLVEVITRGKADFGEDGGVWRIFGTMQRVLGDPDEEELDNSTMTELEDELTSRIESSNEPLVSNGREGVGDFSKTLSAAKGGGTTTTHETRFSTSRGGTPSASATATATHETINPQRQNALDLGYWELDLETGKLKWSPHMFVLYGTDGRGFTPSLERMLNALPEEDRERFEELLHLSVQQRRGFIMKSRMTGEDGAHREVLVAANLVGRRGVGLRLSGVIQDVSPWRRLTRNGSGAR
jgi:PAS domain-containing protein